MKRWCVGRPNRSASVAVSFANAVASPPGALPLQSGATIASHLIHLTEVPKFASAIAGSDLRDRELAVTFGELGGWPGVARRIVGGGDLSFEDASCVFSEILDDRSTPAQIAAFAIGLRGKGASIEEMNGFISSMYEHSELVQLDVDAVDTCGTGGDQSQGTINVSTAAAFVIAATGTPFCG